MAADKFPVEYSHILMFARAVGDPNKIYSDEEYAKTASFNLHDLADKLRERGWLVPAYPMPRNREDLVVQRIVVKEDFSHDLADRLLDDLKRAVAFFESQPGHRAKTRGASFHH